MYKYKNISKEDLSVVGLGVIKAGETIELDYEITNSNLERVVNNNKTKSEKNKDEE